MGFCRKCGNQINTGDIYCPKCGTSTQEPSYQNQNFYTPQYNNDTGHIGWGILGFFVPLAGLILYLVWKDEKPKNSLMAGKGALISVIVSVVFSILAIIAYAVFAVAFFATW